MRHTLVLVTFCVNTRHEGSCSDGSGIDGRPSSLHLFGAHC